MNSHDSLINQLKEAGFEDIAPMLVASAQECIGIETTLCDENTLPIGASKLGGFPDLPYSVDWPHWNGKSLSFICQLNLDEIPSNIRGPLPALGLLSFFYDPDQTAWGFDPAHKEAWRVFYHDLTHEKIIRRELPSDLRSRTDNEEPGGLYSPCGISYKNTLSLPHWNSTQLDPILADEEMDRYAKFLEQWNASQFPGPHHQIFGHAEFLQGDMRLECQLVSHGIYCGDAKGYQHPRRAELEATANQWQLLLQLDSDEQTGMMWGDAGRLYFWCRQEDILQCRLDATWMILQCY